MEDAGMNRGELLGKLLVQPIFLSSTATKEIATSPAAYPHSFGTVPGGLPGQKLNRKGRSETLLQPAGHTSNA